MKITNRVPINLMSKQPTPIVYAVQGDNARAIAFDLYCSGSPWVLPDGARALVRYKRPDGGCGVYDTLPDGSCACEITAHTVAVSIAPTVLAAVGTVFVQISIESEGAILSTFPIIVRVEEDLAAETPTPEVYVNILDWAQEEMDKIASELHAELYRHAVNLAENFSYVAEDDGEGNITLKPFNLGATLEVEYPFEAADQLTKTGWYIVASDTFVRIHGMDISRALIRVDGNGDRCRQTWYPWFRETVLVRDLIAGEWGPFSGVNPPRVRDLEYRTTEQYEGFPVYSIHVSVGEVKAKNYGSVKLPVEAPKAFIEITRIAREVKKADPGLAGDMDRYIYYGGADIEETITTSATLGDVDSDGEPDSVTGFTHYLNVENNTDKDLEIRYLLKYIDPDSWVR